MGCSCHNSSDSKTGTIEVCFSSPGSLFVGWIDPCINLPSLNAGDSIWVQNAAIFQCVTNTPGGTLIPFKGIVTFGEKQIEKTNHFVSGRKMLSVVSMGITDLTSSRVNPGRNYYVEITVVNNGTIAVDDVDIRLHSTHPFVVLLPPFSHNISKLNPQQIFGIPKPGQQLFMGEPGILFYRQGAIEPLEYLRTAYFIKTKSF